MSIDIKNISDKKYQSVAINTRDYSAANIEGDYSLAINTGDCSVSTNTGDNSEATNEGYGSAAINLGYQSAAVVEKEASVAIGIGIENKAKGALGCFIVLAEWRLDDGYIWQLENVKAAKVDGEEIKADTFYTLKNGEFVEVENSNID